MIKRIYTILILALVAVTNTVCTYSQAAKKPTIMVIPSETWCHENDFEEINEVQGHEHISSDYAKALRESPELYQAIKIVGQYMSDRGYPLKDLASTLRTVNQNAAKTEMTVSYTTGASVAQTQLDMLLQQASADILIELTWNINSQGPMKSIGYVITALDSYTNKQIATFAGNSGLVPQARSVSEMLGQVIASGFDKFTAQLESYFTNIMTNGREVAFNINIFNNGSGITLESEYNGSELSEIIDDWMAANTVNGQYNISTATEYVIQFEQVRIPLYRNDGKPMDTRNFVNGLRRYLSNSPYGITSKVITHGLGKADLIIGEK